MSGQSQIPPLFILDTTPPPLDDFDDDDEEHNGIDDNDDHLVEENITYPGRFRFLNHQLVDCILFLSMAFKVFIVPWKTELG